VIGGRLADHTLAFMVPIYNPTRSAYPRVRQINRRSPAILPDLARDRGYGADMAPFRRIRLTER
jgi:hypothetical protein